eukprot:g55.t1
MPRRWLPSAAGVLVLQVLILLLQRAGGDVEVSAQSGTALLSRWAAPLNDGGSAVTKYRVEWDTNGGLQEQQVVALSATGPLSGGFALSFRGKRTEQIPHDASPEWVRGALERLPTVGRVAVTRRGAPGGGHGYSWTVSFANNVGDLPALVVNGSALVGADAGARVDEAVKGGAPAFDQGTVGLAVLPLGSAEVWQQQEVQAIEASSDAADLNGFFRASFMGQVSTDIPHSASAAQMAEALEGMSTVDAVTVTAEDVAQSTVAPVRRHGRRWLVTFAAQEGDLPSLLVSTDASASAAAADPHGFGFRTAAHGGSLGGTAASVEVVERVKGGLQLQHIVDGLSAAQNYFVRVAAFSSSGWGAAQVATFAASPSNQPPAAPRDVTARIAVGHTTASELIVTWTAPDVTGGSPVARYLLQWDESALFEMTDTTAGVAVISTNATDARPAAGGSAFDAVCAQSSCTYTIAGLRGGVKYHVRVLAANAVGIGVPASAVPHECHDEVQRIVLHATAANAAAVIGAADSQFTLEMPGSGTTGALNWHASAAAVQRALHGLSSVFQVSVRRYDHSSAGSSPAMDTSGVDTAGLLVEWQVTFHRVQANVADDGAGNVLRLNAAKLGTATFSVEVQDVRAGASAGTQWILPPATGVPPSGPSDVLLSVVSDSQLGVSWKQPTYDGGSPVTKYLVEWDDDWRFTASRAGATADSVVTAAKNCEVVAAQMDPSTQMQKHLIGHLTAGRTYYVRVSAYNGELAPVSSTTGSLRGYGPAVIAEGKVVDSIEPYKTIYKLEPTYVDTEVCCKSLQPAVQPPFKPDQVLMGLSGAKIPNQIDVRHTFATKNVLGYAGTEAGSGGDTITHWRYEWSSQSDFRVFSHFEARAIDATGDPLECAAECVFPLGAEVQSLSLYSSTHQPLGTGSFKLAHGGFTEQACALPVVLSTRGEDADADERGSSLEVTWYVPSITGGDPITKYMVEWSRKPWDSYVKAAQTIVTTHSGGAKVSGSFRLVFDSTACADCQIKGKHTSVEIPYDADIITMRAALQNMVNLGSVTVQRSIDDAFRGTFSWTVTLDSEVGPVPTFQAIATGLHGASIRVDVKAAGTKLPGANYCGGSTCPTVTVTDGSGAAFKHVIYGLVPAQTYFVRVSAFNSLGYGTRRPTTPAGVSVPKQLPGKVTSYFNPLAKPTLHLGSATTIITKFGPPVLDGGDPISQYKIEWDTSPSFASGLNQQPLFHSYVDAGLVLCQRCVTTLLGDVLSVNQNGLGVWLTSGTEFKVGGCTLTVSATPTTDTAIAVVTGHGCDPFGSNDPPRGLTVSDICANCATAFDKSTNALTINEDLSRFVHAGVSFYVRVTNPISPPGSMHDEVGCMFRAASSVWSAGTGTLAVSVDAVAYPYPSAAVYPSKHSCESFGAPETGSVSLLGGEFTIHDLLQGVPYYVRIMARNDNMGWGAPVVTEPPMELPRTAPTAVSNLKVEQGEVAGSSLLATWGKATVVGGSISGYRVERYTKANTIPNFGVQEEQVVAISNFPTGGSFTLAFGDADIALPGTVSAVNGVSFVTTSNDLTALVARGDRIVIGGKIYLVHATALFNGTRLPLASASNMVASLGGPSDSIVTTTANAGNTAYLQANVGFNIVAGATTCAVAVSDKIEAVTTLTQVTVKTGHGCTGFTLQAYDVVLPKFGVSVNPTVSRSVIGVTPENYWSTIVPETMVSYVMRQLAIGLDYTRVTTASHSVTIGGTFSVSLGDYKGDYTVQIGGQDANGDWTYVNVAKDLVLCSKCGKSLAGDVLTTAATPILVKYLGFQVQFELIDGATANIVCRFTVADIVTTSDTVNVAPGHSCSGFTRTAGNEYDIQLVSALTRASPEVARSVGGAALHDHIARGDYLRVGGQEFRVCLDTTIGVYDTANVPLCDVNDPWTAQNFAGRVGLGLVKVPAFKLDTSLGPVQGSIGATALGSVSESFVSREVQIITVTATSAAEQMDTAQGGLRIRFGSEVTGTTTAGGGAGCLLWSSTHTQLEQELETLSNIDDVKVSRTAPTPSPASGDRMYHFAVTVTGSKSRGHMNRIPVFDLGSGTQLVLATARSPILDIQSISTAVTPGHYLSGTFSVSYLGQKTRQLPYDVSSSEMEIALDALCTVENVTVTRNTVERGHTAVSGSVAVYTRREVQSFNVGTSAPSLMNADASAIPLAGPDVVTSAALTVNTDSSLRVQYAPPDRILREGNEGAKVRDYTIQFATRITEQQQIVVKATRGPINAGQYRLDFTNNGATRTTRCLEWDAPAATMERLIEEMDNVDGVSVTRSQQGVREAPNGFVYGVTFDGPALCNGNMTTLVVKYGCPVAFSPDNNEHVVESTTLTHGLAGFAPEVVTIQTKGTCAWTAGECVGQLDGTFDVSMDFHGGWTSNDAFGNPIARVTVAPGTRKVTTDPVSDLRGKINRGDRVKIKGEIFIVDQDDPFTCSELFLDAYHRGGAVSEPIYVEDNAIGNVRATQGSAFVTTGTLRTTHGNGRSQLGITPSFAQVAQSVTVQAAVDEVQTVKTSATADDLTGSFMLVFDKFSVTPQLHSILFITTVTAKDMKRILEHELPTIGKVEVTRKKVGYGFEWAITFGSNFGDLPLIRWDDTQLSGTGKGLGVSETIKGTRPTRQAVGKQLDTGTAYHVRVAASNQGGLGEWTQDHQDDGASAKCDSCTLGMIPLAETVRQPAGAPNITAVGAHSENTLALAYDPPAAIGGDAISSYRIEWTTQPDFTVSEVKTVEIWNSENDDTDGHFKLTFAGSSTIRLEHDCSAEELQDAVGNLTNVGTVNVTRKDISETSKYGHKWTLIFSQDVGKLALSKDPLVAPALNGLTVDISEVRSIAHTGTIGQLNGLADALGGDFRMMIGTETTEAVRYDATDAKVVQELEKLHGVGKVAELKAKLEGLSLVTRVSVERTPSEDVFSGTTTAEFSYGFVYTIQFWGLSSEANLPQLELDPANMPTKGTVVPNTVREGVANTARLERYLSLNRNTTYAVRMAAANAEGYGPVSEVRMATTANVLPGVPRAVALGFGGRYNASSLGLHFEHPLTDGGSEITRYRVEWDASDQFDMNSPHYGEMFSALAYEVQDIIVSFRSSDDVTAPLKARGGTFTLTWGGLTTDPLSFDIEETALAVQIQTITGTTVVGQNPIQVVKSAYERGTRWRVTFKGLRGNLAEMHADGHMLQGDQPEVRVVEVMPGDANLIPGQFTYEVQTITTQALSAIGGTFKLSFEGRETPSIGFDAAAYATDGTSMTEALSGIDTIHTVSVERVNSGPTSIGGRTWKVPTNVTLGLVSSTSLKASWNPPTSNGGSPVTKYKVEWYTGVPTKPVAEVQQISTSANAGITEVQVVRVQSKRENLAGFFKLSFKGEATENIAFNAAATGLNSVKAKLERLSTVGTVNVEREDSKEVVRGMLVDISLAKCTASECVLDKATSNAVTDFTAEFVHTDRIFVANRQYVVKAVDATSVTIEKACTICDELPLTGASAVKVFREINAFGHNWVITFTEDFGDVEQLVAHRNSLSGPSAGVLVSTLTQGVAPTGLAHAVVDATVSELVMGSSVPLQTGAAYFVRVLAQNSEGYGPQ